MSYIYQLPFGRGKKFGNNMNLWEDLLVGGWQVNGITTMQGGNPLQILANNDLSGWNYQVLYANTNFQDASLKGSVKSRLKKYFNTADFSQPAAYSLGNGPAYYNKLRAPGVANTDFSLFKEFMAKGRTAQFRMESFNVLNHVQFGSPNTTVTSTTFGEITSQVNSPRIYQMALKILF
jgi:hypothetical protein